VRLACWFRRRAETIFRKFANVHESHESRKVRDRQARSPTRETLALPGECAQIIRHVWVFRCQRFDIADFDVDFLHAWPFGTRTEEPAPLSDDACSVERIPRDQKLHALAGAEIRTDYGALACAVFVQHKNFNGITQVTVIKLIVANAMESHRRIRRHHEIERGARWPAIKKWCWETAGRNSLVADKCDAHETARGVRLEIEQRANLFDTQIISHSRLNMERRASNV
jgi:hypothetical protein